MTDAPKFLPYAHQEIDDADINAVVASLKSDFLTQGGRVAQFEASICDLTHAPYSSVCNSGTAALHLAYTCLGIGKGDIVIVPNITFAASANAAIFCGAEVIFCDVDAQTGLMDLETIKICYDEFAQKHRIKAVCAVHLNGQLVDLAPIQAFCHAQGLFLIEDACHALGGYYDKAQKYPVGCMEYSDACCLSFHPAKTITSGEGGAVLFAKQNWHDHAQKLRSHGIQRSDFQKYPRNNAPAWYYELPEIFPNYRLPDILCALGISQLTKLHQFVAKRQELTQYYREKIGDSPYFQAIAQNNIGICVWHLMVVQLNGQLIAHKSDIIRDLKLLGVGTQVHYIPMNQHEFYHHNFGHCPNSIKYYHQSLSIPLYTQLTKQDCGKILEMMTMVCKQYAP